MFRKFAWPLCSSLQALKRGLGKRVGLHLNVSEGQPLSDPETIPTLIALNPSKLNGDGARSYGFLGMRTLKERFDAGTVNPDQVCSGTR